jgi:hypothetical protein
VTSAAARRARRWFWALTLLAVLLAGALSRALQAHASPTTGAVVALLGLGLTPVIALDVRLLLALAGRLRAPTSYGQRSSTGPGNPAMTSRISAESPAAPAARNRSVPSR